MFQAKEIDSVILEVKVFLITTTDCLTPWLIQNPLLCLWIYLQEYLLLHRYTSCRKKKRTVLLICQQIKETKSYIYTPVEYIYKYLHIYTYNKYTYLYTYNINIYSWSTYIYIYYTHTHTHTHAYIYHVQIRFQSACTHARTHAYTQVSLLSEPSTSPVGFPVLNFL